MFGLPEALMSFIRRQVGLRTDEGDENGSLHAKTKEVKQYLSSTIVGTELPKIQRPRRTYAHANIVTADVLGTTYEQLYSLSGKGKLRYIIVQCGGPGGYYVNFKIQIDGTDVMFLRVVGGFTVFASPVIAPGTRAAESISWGDDLSSGGSALHLSVSTLPLSYIYNPEVNLSFSSSLKLFAKASSPCTGYAKLFYEKEV